MRYDRDYRHRRRGQGPYRGEWMGRGEYGEGYEGPEQGGFHGYGMGYTGGALRSRGSFQAGQLRSGLNPVDEFEFQWGDGYVGGRGYGGTNYDLDHGYQVGGTGRWREQVYRPEPGAGRQTSPATRGGYQWAEYGWTAGEPFGPARYGYGPYHERLRRRRRSDDEIRKDVEDALFYDTWVDADRISVEVRDGVVTLSGTLASFEEVRYANDDVWDVDGVRGVMSNLEVDESLRVPGGKREAERQQAQFNPANVAEGDHADSAPAVAKSGARTRTAPRTQRGRQRKTAATAETETQAAGASAKKGESEIGEKAAD